MKADSFIISFGAGYAALAVLEKGASGIICLVGWLPRRSNPAWSYWHMADNEEEFNTPFVLGGSEY